MKDRNYIPLISNTFNLPQENIDTDQIIPAQFLTTTTRKGLGQLAFYHWRFDEAGQEYEQHPFSNFNPQSTSILVAGNNFGCGSSREHAPWALIDMGFRAVISTEIADIFRNNSIKNSFLPVLVDKDALTYLHEHPGSTVAINVLECTCHIDGYGIVEFPMDEFSSYCLSRDYDQLDYLITKTDQIKQFEKTVY